MKTKITFLMCALIIGAMSFNTMAQTFEFVERISAKEKSSDIDLEDYSPWSVNEHVDGNTQHWQAKNKVFKIYGEDQGQDDWLITPAIDLSNGNYACNFVWKWENPNNGYRIDLLMSTNSKSSWDTLVKFNDYQDLPNTNDFDSTQAMCDTISNGAKSTYLALRFYSPDTITTATNHKFYVEAIRISKEKVSSARSIISNELSVYPNPASSELYIGLEGAVSVEVHNLVGQLVISETDVLKTLDVSNLLEGQYIIKVKQNDKVYVNKFVKR